MAQARVTEYFSTRGNKRNRLGGGDEVLLNKSTKSQGLPDSPKHDDEITLIKQRLHATINQEQRRATRSKTKSTAEQSTAAATTVQEAPTKKTREAAGAKKREEIKALKAKMNHVNFQIEKAVAEPEPAPEASAKKRLNRDELKKKMEQFNARLVHIQSQEPEKTTTTSAVVQKDEPQQTPAYLKFQELSEKQPPVASEETLPLPKSYALLLDFFKACETILKMMTNRNDPVTFQRLKRGVENITKHTFALRHLGQLRHVYPEAYSFRQEKMFIDFKNDYHLLIAPNFAEIEASQASGQREFTPAVMLKRQTQCEANLLRIVKEQHRTFLDSLGMDGLVDDGERRLKRWHPKFELDRAAEIEIAELPRPPSQDSVECKTGKELLNIAAAIYSSRIQEAIKATVEELDAKVRADETDEVKVRAPSTAAAASKAEDSQNLTPDQLAQIKLKEKKESAHNALLERVTVLFVKFYSYYFRSYF